MQRRFVNGRVVKKQGWGNSAAPIYREKPPRHSITTTTSTTTTTIINTIITNIATMITTIVITTTIYDMIRP